MRRKFTVYGLRFSKTSFWNRMNTGFLDLAVATVLLTACGMRRRVRGSRGAKRRWGPHISSPWPKGGENKGNEVTVPTACGIETLYRSGPISIGSRVATVPTAWGMRRRVRGSRGAKRRWGPHISSPWPKGRENKGDKATVPTACGIETLRNRICALS